MRLLVGMLVGAVLAAQTPREPLVFGPQARWLRQADIEAIARAAAPYGGPPWLIAAVRRTPPSRNRESQWFAFAYLAPTSATAEFRRGAYVKLATARSTEPLADTATWRVEPARIPMRWAQVAMPGRAFEDVANERDENWPMGMSDDITDADLLSIVRFLRSRPVIAVPPGLNLGTVPVPGPVRGISAPAVSEPALAAARVTLGTGGSCTYEVALERREQTWTGAVTRGVGCGDAASSNPDVPPQR